MKSQPFYYYIAILPVWMLINVGLTRTTRLVHRGLTAAWKRGIAEIRDYRTARRQGRALRRWMASAEAQS